MLGEKPYKIYEYYPDIDVYRKNVPLSINFKTGLSVRLHPVRTFVLGEMVECVYYASMTDGVPSDPVVKETWEYTRDGTGYAVSRLQKLFWYYDDGVLDEREHKIMEKYYDTLLDRRSESYRRLKNQTTAASEVVIGGLMQMGYTYENAVSEGFGYWQGLVALGLISQFEEGNQQPLVDHLNNDSSNEWISTLAPAVVAELVE